MDPQANRVAQPAGAGEAAGSASRTRLDRRKRLLTATAIVLALTGTLLIAYPFATDLWAAHLQRGLSGQLRENASAYRDGDVGVGRALTRLEIPKLDVDVVVVEGTTPAALHAGAGHYPDTPLPGQDGNVAIAGHRTTYGRPFNRLVELDPGDRVILTTPIGRHVYEISEEPWVVEAYDWAPVKRYPAEGAWLTLTTCHPEGSATHRVVARAKLVSSSVRGTG
jgi:sortase A